MFNNPFDSFHNTVAEAKEEREQLDRLLTVSTPRERQLVAVIALLLLILAAWLFFGNVGRSLAVDAVLIESGKNLVGSDQTVQALIWVEGEAASHFKAGTPAAIELEMANGEAGTFDGELGPISAVPLSAELAAFDSAAPVSVHRVTIVIDSSYNLASLVGRECKLIIQVSGESLVDIFGLRRS